jgi:hypothetical protein
MLNCRERGEAPMGSFLSPKAPDPTSLTSVQWVRSVKCMRERTLPRRSLRKVRVLRQLLELPSLRVRVRRGTAKPAMHNLLVSLDDCGNSFRWVSFRRGRPRWRSPDLVASVCRIDPAGEAGSGPPCGAGNRIPLDTRSRSGDSLMLSCEFSKIHRRVSPVLESSARITPGKGP